MKNIALMAALAVASVLSLGGKPALAADTMMGSAPSKQMMSMNQQMLQSNKMMVQMLGKSDAQYDLRFIDMMIPHHEGALLMAQDALKNAKHQEVKSLAKNIIDAQKKEIAQLKQWRKQWYGK